MTDIAFYHLQKDPLETVLPKLLEKSMQAQKKALVRVGSTQRVNYIDGVLWSYAPVSWLPHGKTGDMRAQTQPIWVTDKEENPASAEYVFLADGCGCTDISAFERAFELFDGNADDAVHDARQRWQAYKDAGHTLTYWQQSPQGAWQQKA